MNADPSLMNSQTTQPDEAWVPEESEPSYRAVCSKAVVAGILALLSPLVWLDPIFALIPVLSLFLALRAIKQIRHSPDQWIGIGPSYCSAILATICLCLGLGTHAYVYATECPPGHLPISFEELQPNPNVVGQPFPPSVLQLDGKKVFIKGFMLAGAATMGITEFILVRDRGECCFGGNPKITDRVQVQIDKPQGIEYTIASKVAGTFHVDPTRSRGVYYYLEGAQVR